MPGSVITSKGQTTTIPKKIREYLHLQPGDKIDYVVNAAGKVTIEPSVLDVMELEGALRRPEMKPLSDGQIREAVSKRFGRA